MSSYNCFPKTKKFGRFCLFFYKKKIIISLKCFKNFDKISNCTHCKKSKIQILEMITPLWKITL